MTLRRTLRRSRGPLAALLVLVSPMSSVPAADPDIVTSYGFAAFGELKYPQDFEHFDYANPDAPKGGTYRSASPGYYDSFNLFSLIGFPPFGLTLLYDKLMERSLDEPASQYGMIAKSISYPSDLSWVEFQLRPEAKFSDGMPVTPEDVIFSVQIFQKSGRPLYRRVGAAVEDVVKTGPHSVRMILTQKNNPTLVQSVGELTVLPRHFYEGKSFTKASMEVPVGSGPYKIKNFSPGRWVQLERREDYWARDLPVARGRYNMDIRYDWYRDASVYAEAFLAGDYDFRIDLSALRWKQEEGLPAIERGDIVRDRIRYSTPITYQGIILNTRRPFLRDRRVREAMVRAFDFEWYQRNILLGHHERVLSNFDNSDFAIAGLPTPGELELLEPWAEHLPAELFTTKPSLPKLGNRARQRQNLLEAAKLLREAGYRVENLRLVDPRTRQPVELDIMSGYGAPYERNVAQFMRNLDRLGIKANFRIYDNSTVRQLTARYDYDMRISVPNVAVQVSPGVEMRNEFGSAGVTAIDSRNLSGVDSPVVDDMLDKLLAARDRDETVNAMRAMNRVLFWGYYSIPLQHTYPAPTGVMPFSYWNRFGRPRVEPTYNFPIYTLDHWWIDKAKAADLEQRLGKSR
jgi:microcin C transport system substrate-binding protein